MSADDACVYVCVCLYACVRTSKTSGEKPVRRNPSSAFLKVLSRRRANPISFNRRLLRTADFISVHTRSRAGAHALTHTQSCPYIPSLGSLSASAFFLHLFFLSPLRPCPPCLLLLCSSRGLPPLNWLVQGIEAQRSEGITESGPDPQE